MRTAWLKTIAATLSAVALTGTSVLANPALMAARPIPKPQAVSNAAPTASFQSATPPRAQASSSKNPIKFLQASLPDLPFGIGKRDSANPVARPVVHSDAISLDTPVGAPTPKLLIAAAQLAESRGDVATARANFQQALNMWPGDVEVLRAAARMEDRLGQLQIAETLYRQAIAANPGHAGALNDLGLCLARQGQLDASIQVIEQAIQIQPDKALYRNNAATVLVEMRQDQRAIAHLAHVHDAADANYNFGQLLVMRGRAADATQYFQAAIDQNPQMQHAHVALAKLRGEQSSRTVTSTPAATPPTPAPAATEPTPAQVPQSPSQMDYPVTAQAPATVPAQSTAAATQPQHLPPVAARPGQVQR